MAEPDDDGRRSAGADAWRTFLLGLPFIPVFWAICALMNRG